jgi:hypothetical protein
MKKPITPNKDQVKLMDDLINNLLIEWVDFTATDKPVALTCLIEHCKRRLNDEEEELRARIVETNKEHQDAIEALSRFLGKKPQ